jgi:hypothetical protein
MLRRAHEPLFDKSIRMPTITYSISHGEKLVFIEVQSEALPQEVQDALLAIRAAGALPYRKLIDLSFAPLSQDLTGIRAIKALSQDAGGAGKDALRGPVAFVVGSEPAGEMVALFHENTRLNRPLRVFRDIDTARRWLDEIAAPETIQPETPSP